MDPCQPDFRRFEAALARQEPDRVPFAEISVDYEIMTQFLGAPVLPDDLAAQVRFWREAGYDYIPLTAGMMQPGRVTEESHVSRVLRGILLADSADARRSDDWNLERKAWIESEDDFERFPWQAMGAPDFRKFHAVQAHLPAGMKIVVLTGKIFTLAWMLMGFENFCVQLLLEPAFVDRVLRRVAEIQLRTLEAAVRIPNVGAVWCVDDLAFGSGPMLSPAAFRRHLFPWYEEVARVSRAAGLHLLFHTDGVIWDLIDDLLAVGVEALHPIDPTCMDIEEVKERVGRRVCLVGNVSNELLCTGTPDEVAAVTRRRLRRLAPGGGYCLSAGNSVPHWTRIDNYRAMLATGLAHGRYPIA